MYSFRQIRLRLEFRLSMTKREMTWSFGILQQLTCLVIFAHSTTTWWSSMVKNAFYSSRFKTWKFEWLKNLLKLYVSFIKMINASKSIADGLKALVYLHIFARWLFLSPIRFWCHYCDFFECTSSTGLFKFTSYIKICDVITDEKHRMLNRTVVIEAYFFFAALMK